MHKTQALKVIESIFKSTGKPINLNTLFLKTKEVLPKAAYSTVYRIAQKLEKEGKITKIDWRDRGSFYEWSKLSHHHHLVCEQCNVVSDIDDNILSFNDQSVSKKTGFIIKSHSIELYGICQPCQERVM